MSPIDRREVSALLGRRLMEARASGDKTLTAQLERLLSVVERSEPVEQPPTWWKSVAFVLSVLAAVASALVAAGVFAAGSTAQRVVSGVAAVLTLLGFRGALLMPAPSASAGPQPPPVPK
jgi:hypothetical protein